MIKILIIEDELLACKRLEKLLLACSHPIEIIGKCHSYASAKSYLSEKHDYDVVMMDIHLGDGMSLHLFEELEILKPVIFTTAFDEYMLKAFKMYSIDYLMKPIDQIELNAAIQKYITYFNSTSTDVVKMEQLLNQVNGEDAYKKRFLAKLGAQHIIISVDHIAYFFTEDGYSHVITRDYKKYIIEYSLDAIQKSVSPLHFFRINRSMIIHLDIIDKVSTYFNSRLSLTLKVTERSEIIVARERVKEFLNWLDR